MDDVTLTRLRGCVVQQDRAAALQVVRVATAAGLLPPREAVELMLVVQDGTPDMVLQAIDAMRTGVPGSYRYAPTADYAVA